jgi:quinolinate synthase
MADMADIDQVEECWDTLADVTDVSQIVPITYMNSSAALKAFVGEHGGAVCTSSNARAILEWALGTERASAAEVPSVAPSEQFGKGSKVLFFPDQHLGRNTGFAMGYQARDMRVWNPRFELGGLEERDVKEATLLLWKGHCSVHQRFRPEHVAAFRMEHPRGEVIVHPECAHDVVELADRVGSTERILDWVEQAPAGSVLGIGTEIHMVQRMANEHPDLTITSLDPLVCPCSTMFRIDGPHLAWVLESLVRGEVVNQITVDPHTSEWARVALQRMLDIT